MDQFYSVQSEAIAPLVLHQGSKQQAEIAILLNTALH